MEEFHSDPVCTDPVQNFPKDPDLCRLSLYFGLGLQWGRLLIPVQKHPGNEDSIPRKCSFLRPGKVQFGGGLVFCLRFWLFARQKQHILAISRPKREKGRNKKEDQTNIGRAFFGRKVLFFSPVLCRFLTKT